MASVTVTAQVPDFPPALAEMVAVPALTAVTTPSATVAMVASLVVQMTPVLLVALAGRTVATKVTVSPSLRVAVVLSKVTDSTGTALEVDTEAEAEAEALAEADGATDVEATLEAEADALLDVAEVGLLQLDKTINAAKATTDSKCFVIDLLLGFLTDPFFPFNRRQDCSEKRALTIFYYIVNSSDKKGNNKQNGNFYRNLRNKMPF
jgi:hypothetical protein